MCAMAAASMHQRSVLVNEVIGSMAGADVKRILCYGDSNTWGFIPGTGQRYDSKTRWTGVAQGILGDDYCIVESGLNGRTTVFNDPCDTYRNGASGLGYALLEASPVDLVVLALGTNDLKFTDSLGSARGITSLVLNIKRIASYLPSDFYFGGATELTDPMQVKVLIVSPILVHPEIKTLDPQTVMGDGNEQSLNFTEAYRRAAAVTNSWFLDASEVARPSDIDGIHMMPESHKALGQAVAEKILEIFPRQ